MHPGESHTIARGPGPPRDLGFCANQPIPWPKRALHPKARPFSDGMGARSGVNPERPYRPQTFAEGQDAPGIRRVVRRPLAIPGNPLPKHIPAGMSAIPSASGPKPPAAFPVGHAAGGGISHP